MWQKTTKFTTTIQWKYQTFWRNVAGSKKFERWAVQNSVHRVDHLENAEKLVASNFDRRRYTCIHTYMHSIHAYMLTCLITYILIDINSFIHTCMHAWMYTYLHTYLLKHLPLRVISTALVSSTISARASIFSFSSTSRPYAGRAQRCLLPHADPLAPKNWNES